MRSSFILLAGLCLMQPAPAQAQDPKPQPPAQGATKPQEPPTERKEVKVAEKVLKTYVGEYEMGPDRILTLTLEDGYLWGQPTNQSKRQLFAESQTKFFLKDLDAQVTFQKDPKGAVIGMVMDQAGRPQRELKKIK